jgi:hypothetical protein
MGLTFDMWIPATSANALSDGPEVLEDRNVRGYQVLAALRSGATIADARRELATAMQTLAQLYPSTNSTMTAEILQQWQSPRGPQRAMTAATCDSAGGDAARAGSCRGQHHQSCPRARERSTARGCGAPWHLAQAAGV